VCRTMSPSEERHCYYGGKYHLRSIFFAYWVQCKDCGTFVCPEHSGFRNQKTAQYNFLLYMLVGYFFYFGFFLILSPIKGETPGLIMPYLYAGVILFIPFLVLAITIRSVVRRFSQQPGAITQCPKCQGSIKVLYHDIFLYFWIFSIHVLYLSTVLNEIGIIFYNFYLAKVQPSLMFVFLLLGLVILILFLFKRVGSQFMASYKMNTRAWLGEIAGIFLYLTIIFILFLTSTFLPGSQFSHDIVISFNLFYAFTAMTFMYFPAFLIGGLIYKVSQKYLLSVNRSNVTQIIFALLYIIIPFYIWGILSFSLGIYITPSFNADILPFYSSIFNEILPFVLLALLLGMGITSLFRTLLGKVPKTQAASLFRVCLLFGTSLLSGFIILENLYYFTSGSFFLDLFSPIIVNLLLILFLSSCFVIVCYELFHNWASPHSFWGGKIEKKLGSFMFILILACLMIALSLSFSLLIMTSSTITILPDFQYVTNFSLILPPLILKSMFFTAFVGGLLLGLKKSN